jgi:hypothetical protein
MVRLGVVFIAVLATVLALGQQTAPKKPNELVVGKLVYVAPIPSDLDRWIGDFLQQWGKYKVTGNPEGVDLIINAVSPEKEMELVMRGGVPQPRDEGRRFPRPSPRKEGKGIRVTSISVTDWVTNEVLWQADILDRKQKKDEANPPAGPHTTIFARGLTPDQLAQKIAAKLRQYVGELEKTSAVPTH